MFLVLGNLISWDLCWGIQVLINYVVGLIPLLVKIMLEKIIMGKTLFMWVCNYKDFLVNLSSGFVVREFKFPLDLWLKVLRQMY